MKGKMDKLSGKTKQTVGKMTNDKEMQARGKVQETTGKIKDKTER